MIIDFEIKCGYDLALVFRRQSGVSDHQNNPDTLYYTVNRKIFNRIHKGFVFESQFMVPTLGPREKISDITLYLTRSAPEDLKQVTFIFDSVKIERHRNEPNQVALLFPVEVN